MSEWVVHFTGSSDALRSILNDRSIRPSGPFGQGRNVYLSYAVACRWLAGVDYVYCPGGGSDELPLVMRDRDPGGGFIQLSPMTSDERRRIGLRGKPVVLDRPEPAVPYRSVRAEDYMSEGDFDFVCLTRSPPYTPPTADRLFDLIRSLFVEPIETTEA